MKRLAVTLVAALVCVGGSAPGVAQSKPDFSGKWIYQQRKSSQGNLSGNGPLIVFATTLVVKQLPTEVQVERTTLRQDPISASYKLDGTEVSVAAPEGITEKAKAV